MSTSNLHVYTCVFMHITNTYAIIPQREKERQTDKWGGGKTFMYTCIYSHNSYMSLFYTQNYSDFCSTFFDLLEHKFIFLQCI